MLQCDDIEQLGDNVQIQASRLDRGVQQYLSEVCPNLGYREGNLPATGKYTCEVLSIPMYSGMTVEAQEWVIRVTNQYQDRVIETG